MGKVVQRGVYVDDEQWTALRRHALDSGVSASGIVGALIAWYLDDAPAKLKASITENATART